METKSEFGDFSDLFNLNLLNYSNEIKGGSFGHVYRTYPLKNQG